MEKKIEVNDIVVSLVNKPGHREIGQMFRVKRINKLTLYYTPEYDGSITTFRLANLDEKKLFESGYEFLPQFQFETGQMVEVIRNTTLAFLGEHSNFNIGEKYEITCAIDHFVRVKQKGNGLFWFPSYCFKPITVSTEHKNSNTFEKGYKIRNITLADLGSDEYVSIGGVLFLPGMLHISGATISDQLGRILLEGVSSFKCNREDFLNPDENLSYDYVITMEMTNVKQQRSLELASSSETKTISPVFRPLFSLGFRLKTLNELIDEFGTYEQLEKVGYYPEMDHLLGQQISDELAQQIISCACYCHKKDFMFTNLKETEYEFLLNYRLIINSPLPKEKSAETIVIGTKAKANRFSEGYRIKTLVELMKDFGNLDCLSYEKMQHIAGNFICDTFANRVLIHGSSTSKRAYFRNANLRKSYDWLINSNIITKLPLPVPSVPTDVHSAMEDMEGFVIRDKCGLPTVTPVTSNLVKSEYVVFERPKDAKFGPAIIKSQIRFSSAMSAKIIQQKLYEVNNSVTDAPRLMQKAIADCVSTNPFEIIRLFEEYVIARNQETKMINSFSSLLIDSDSTNNNNNLSLT